MFSLRDSGLGVWVQSIPEKGQDTPNQGPPTIELAGFGMAASTISAAQSNAPTRHSNSTAIRKHSSST